MKKDTLYLLITLIILIITAVSIYIYKYVILGETFNYEREVNDTVTYDKDKINNIINEVKENQINKQKDEDNSIIDNNEIDENTDDNNLTTENESINEVGNLAQNTSNNI